ncbi:MAG: hypothetical protein ACE366_30460 [Bradymonadia bacterium]
MRSSKRLTDFLTLVFSISLATAVVGCDSEESEGDNGGAGGAGAVGGEAGGGAGGAAGGEAGAGGGEAGAGGGEAGAGGGEAGAGGGEAGAGGMAMGGEGGGEPPAPVCEGNEFFVNSELARFQDPGFRYIGIDDRFNGPISFISVEVGDTVEAGSYDLAGTNFNDCEVCVYAAQGCGENGCEKIFYADEGSVEITGFDGPGGQWQANFNNTIFTEVDLGPGNVSTPVDGGETFCMADQAFDVTLPSLVNHPVPNFELQNCATGEFESMHDIVGDIPALWIVLSAGWCSACHQFIPNVMLPTAQARPDAIKPIIIVGEDDNFGPVDLDFCERYASRYEAYDADLSMFYIDHDGTSSFSTMFANMWAYFGPNGEFGLPWNGLIRGGDNVYFYGDGASGQGREGLTDALNTLIGE